MSTSANEKAGQSRRKSVKSGSQLNNFTTRGRNWYCSTLDGFFQSYDNPGYLYRGPYVALTESQLNKQAKHTKFYHFSERISIAEHWKFVAESSEFHLTLSRAHLERIFSNSKYAKKARHFKSKAGKRDDAKKA